MNLRAWVRAHPKITTAIGVGAAAAATAYGGPAAGQAATKVLPIVCDLLKLCA